MLKITKVLETNVTITVQETGKTFSCNTNYAKHIIESHTGEPKEKALHEYLLREGRGWMPVSAEEFAKATSEEVVEKLHEQLAQELRQRVEKSNV